MHAIALAARELPDPLLLVGARKVEPRHVRTRIHLAFSKLDDVEPVRDLFPNGFVRVERVARLVDIAEFDLWRDLKRACIRSFLFGDQAKQRGFSGTVRPDHADDT